MTSKDDPSSECAKLQRLLDRYRDLLAGARDEMLRRGIMSQIESLEAKLRSCDEEERATTALPLTLPTLAMRLLD